MKKLVLVKEMFTNGLNTSWTQGDWVENTVRREETHWLSGKEKVPHATFSKEGYADSVLWHEKDDITFDFLWKGQTENIAGNFQLYWLISPYLLNNPCAERIMHLPLLF